MRTFFIALVFAIGGLAANADNDLATLEALKQGDMKKLIFDGDPKPVSDAAFGDLEGGSHRLSDYRGKIVLLNFWATWCAPCREEMPSLDALQAELGGDAFEVVTLATGRNSPAGMRRFFEDEDIVGLPLFTDIRQGVARDMGVLGLPTTVLIDREGREIARLRGDADWASDSSKAIMRALIDANG